MPIQVLMPALSPTMTEGKLAKWAKKEGEKVSSGDVIAEIETDKATMEVEAVDEGTLGKILVAEGTEGVAVNAPIALLLEEGEDASALQGADGGTPPLTAKQETKAPPPEPAKPAEPAPATGPAPASRKADGGGRIFASPLAKRLAKEAGLDLSRIEGSGPHGRIVKADVEKAKTTPRPEAKPAPAPAPAAAEAPAAPKPAPMPEVGPPYIEKPNSSMRKVIAKRLTAVEARGPALLSHHRLRHRRTDGDARATQQPGDGGRSGLQDLGK